MDPLSLSLVIIVLILLSGFFSAFVSGVVVPFSPSPSFLRPLEGSIIALRRFAPFFSLPASSFSVKAFSDFAVFLFFSPSFSFFEPSLSGFSFAAFVFAAFSLFSAFAEDTSVIFTAVGFSSEALPLIRMPVSTAVDG